MPVVVEVWYRRKRGDAYRRDGTEQVDALQRLAGDSQVDGKDRRVVVDQVACNQCGPFTAVHAAPSG